MAHIAVVPPGGPSAHRPAPQAWPRAAVYADVGFVVGFFAVLYCWVPVVNASFGTIALTLGLLARRTDPHVARGAALTAIALGASALFVAAVLLVGFVLFAST